jgi:hypothetical protein
VTQKRYGVGKPPAPVRPQAERPASAQDDKAAIDVLKHKIAEKIERDPRKAAIVLTDWMQKKKAA